MAENGSLPAAFAQSQTLSQRQTRVISYWPCPDLSRLGQCQWELSSTLNLTHAQSIQSVDHVRHVTAITTTSTQLAKVTVAPRVNCCIFSQSQCLSISTTKCYLYYSLSWQRLHLHQSKHIYLHLTANHNTFTCTSQPIKTSSPAPHSQSKHIHLHLTANHSTSTCTTQPIKTHPPA